MNTVPLSLDVSDPARLAASFWPQRKGYRSTALRCDCSQGRAGKMLRAWAATFILPSGGTLLWITGDSEGPALAYLLTTDAPSAVAYPYGRLSQARAPQCGCSWFLIVAHNGSGELDISARRADGFDHATVVAG